MGWNPIRDAQMTFSSGGLNKIFGGGSTPSDNSGEFAAAEEARKAALRRRIDALYGVGEYPQVPAPTPQGGGQVSNLVARITGPAVAAQNGENADLSSTAGSARTQLDTERKQVSDATRGYYTDQLSRAFAGSERNARFRLARQGLQGGSVDVDTNAELQTDQNLGATRIDEAARRASADLDTQREQERLNAIQLVNAGAGDSAVSSAQAGLRNSLNNVQNASKANLFGDLFTAGADGYAGANYNAALAAQLGRYQDALGSYFSPSRTTSGRVTAS